MPDLAVQLHWHRASPVLQTGAYSSEHVVQYNNPHKVTADPATDWGGTPADTNPEQALASALSNCHMTTLLALGAKAGWPVAIYHDYAETHLGKSTGGQMSGTRIDLHPVVRFDTVLSVRDERPAQMQDRAHRYCFIANTLADSVEINILWGPDMSHFFCASHGRVAPVRGVA